MRGWFGPGVGLAGLFGALVLLSPGRAGAEPGVDDALGGVGSGVVLEGLEPGMEVTLDGAGVRPDAVGFVAVPSGASHRVTVRAPGCVPFDVRVALAPREKRVVSVRLAREPSEAGGPPPVRVRGGSLLERHWPSLTALGLALAATSVGVAFHVLAEQDWSSLREAARADDGAIVAFTEREAWARADRARGREVGSWVGFGVGGGLLLTSVVLLSLEPFGEGAAVVVAPVPGGVSLSAAW